MDLSQGAYNGVDEERLYFFTPSWQMVEEWVDDDLDSTVEYRAQQFWGVRYIDDAVARRLDRDNDGAWTTQANDNWYYLTDVMFSVRGITDNDGQIHTRVDYTPYGVAMHRYAADVDGNGLINATDITIYSINANVSPPLQPGDTNYDPDTDLNGDGFAAGSTAEQATFFNQRWSPYSTGGGNPTVNAGWIDNPSDPNGPDNQVGFHGFSFNLAGASDATSTGIYAVRHRTYEPSSGRWYQRDPILFAGGVNWYEALASSPATYSDSSGLKPGDPYLASAGPLGFGYHAKTWIDQRSGRSITNGSAGHYYQSGGTFTLDADQESVSVTASARAAVWVTPIKTGTLNPFAWVPSGPRSGYFTTASTGPVTGSCECIDGEWYAKVSDPLGASGRVDFAHSGRLPTGLTHYWISSAAVMYQIQTVGPCQDVTFYGRVDNVWGQNFSVSFGIAAGVPGLSFDIFQSSFGGSRHFASTANWGTYRYCCEQ
ncbi:MAG: hypothetical protein D6692_04280 [Planctomycetota bacterium]|nr:MAG: hypothetical protein D6692_04280 [Planctomycetota bacterium]